MIWCVLVFWRFCRFDGAYTCYLLVPDKYIARLGGYLISVIAVHSQWRQRRPRAQSAQARADRAAHGARRLYAIHFLCRFISRPLSLCDALVSSCLVQVVVVGISSSVSELVTVMSDTHTHKRTRHSKSERDEEEKREKSSKAVTDCQLLTAAAEGEQKKKAEGETPTF